MIARPSAILGFLGGSGVKNLPVSAGESGDTGSIPGSRIAPGGGMATHSSILDRKIPWTEGPGGIFKVRHD